MKRFGERSPRYRVLRWRNYTLFYRFIIDFSIPEALNKRYVTPVTSIVRIHPPSVTPLKASSLGFVSEPFISPHRTTVRQGFYAIPTKLTPPFSVPEQRIRDFYLLFVGKGTDRWATQIAQDKTISILFNSTQYSITMPSFYIHIERCRKNCVTNFKTYFKIALGRLNRST